MTDRLDTGLAELRRLGRLRSRHQRQLRQVRPEWQEHIRAAYAAGVPGTDIAEAAACTKNYVYKIATVAAAGRGSYELTRLRQLGQRHARLTQQLAAIRPRWEELIRKVSAAGVMQAEIAQAAGCTRDSVRTLCLDTARREAERQRRRQRTRKTGRQT